MVVSSVSVLLLKFHKHHILIMLLSWALAVATVSPPPDWAAKIANGDLLFSSEVPSAGFYPSIGNGNIAGVVGCGAESDLDVAGLDPQREYSGVLYMAGIFNGRSSSDPSQRAMVPGVHSVLLTGSTQEDELSAVGAALDLELGLFLNRTRLRSSACPAATPDGSVLIEQQWYAHRRLRGLLAHRILVSGVAREAPCTLSLLSCNAAPTPRHDLNWTVSAPWRADSQSDYAHAGGSRDSGVAQVTVASGTTIASEVPGMALSSVGAAFYSIPRRLTLPPQRDAERSASFFAAFRTTAESDALRNHTAAALAAMALDDYVAAANTSWAEMMASHRAAWAAEQEGGVEVEGNVTVASTINSSLYYLRASIRADVPHGASPGGLPTNACAPLRIHRLSALWKAPCRRPPVEAPPVEAPPVEAPPVEAPPVEGPPVDGPPAELPSAAAAPLMRDRSAPVATAAAQTMGTPFGIRRPG